MIYSVAKYWIYNIIKIKQPSSIIKYKQLQVDPYSAARTDEMDSASDMKFNQAFNTSGIMIQCMQQHW